MPISKQIGVISFVLIITVMGSVMKSSKSKKNVLTIDQSRLYSLFSVNLLFNESEVFSKVGSKH